VAGDGWMDGLRLRMDGWREIERVGETDLQILQTFAGSRGTTSPEVPMAGWFLGLRH